MVKIRTSQLLRPGKNDDAFDIVSRHSEPPRLFTRPTQLKTSSGTMVWIPTNSWVREAQDQLIEDVCVTKAKVLMSTLTNGGVPRMSKD